MNSSIAREWVAQLRQSVNILKDFLAPEEIREVRRIVSSLLTNDAFPTAVEGRTQLFRHTMRYIGQWLQSDIDQRNSRLLKDERRLVAMRTELSVLIALRTHIFESYLEGNDEQDR